MSRLFAPLKLRGVTLPNRLVLSPMSQYEARNGFVSGYHMVHYGEFALGGFGGVLLEATAVSEDGRITHGDIGLWRDDQIDGLASIAAFLKRHDVVAGVQISHAGPKAAIQQPYYGDDAAEDTAPRRGMLPWPIVFSNNVPLNADWQMPDALSAQDIAKVKCDFANAAHRALAAGFDVLELHCAHGYLLNSFLSPLTNHRKDEYGGDLKGRMRLPLEVVAELRAIWPEEKPFFVRISVVDGNRAGTSVEDSIVFAAELARLGVDLIDCSSGGIGSYDYPSEHGYQVPYAARIREEAKVLTMSVGLIVSPAQAEDIVGAEQSDLVAIGRAALRDPHFPRKAASELQVRSK